MLGQVGLDEGVQPDRPSCSGMQLPVLGRSGMEAAVGLGQGAQVSLGGGVGLVAGAAAVDGDAFVQLMGCLEEHVELRFGVGGVTDLMLAGDRPEGVGQVVVYDGQRVSDVPPHYLRGVSDPEPDIHYGMEEVHIGAGGERRALQLPDSPVIAEVDLVASLVPGGNLLGPAQRPIPEVGDLS